MEISFNKKLNKFFIKGFVFDIVETEISYTKVHKLVSAYKGFIIYKKLNWDFKQFYIIPPLLSELGLQKQCLLTLHNNFLHYL